MIYPKENIEIIDLGDDDGTVIYDSESGDTNILDGVAADIFQCFSQYHETESVIKELSKIYDEDTEVIRKDVLEFIEKLIEQGLLVERSA